MSNFTIASFNVKNLIGAEQEYYKFEEYTPEEYAWKKDWLADQLLSMNADIVCFQEIFEQPALYDIVEETNTRGSEYNAAVIPDKSKRYHRKAVFRKLKYEAYENGTLFFAPNYSDGGPGERQPGLAILSRYGFEGEPEVIQELSEPLVFQFTGLRGKGDAGSFTLTRISRPIIKARVNIEGTIVTLFNCHLKSKLGEYVKPKGAAFAAEADLTDYDPVGRAMGSARAAMRRMAEALVLRRAIVEELKLGNPVMVMGDFNDGEHAVSSEIITGEVPFKNYAWMRRHDAENRNERYSEEENIQIRGDIEKFALTSAEKLFVRKSLRDMVYTSAFGGVYESIDQIFLSRHFHPDNAERLGEMEYFSVLNDHLTDGSHSEAPYNKLASDHGQIIAHFKLVDGEQFRV